MFLYTTLSPFNAIQRAVATARKRALVSSDTPRARKRALVSSDIGARALPAALIRAFVSADLVRPVFAALMRALPSSDIT